MLFHVKQIVFERECHSNARVVRTVIEYSNGSHLRAEIKKGGSLATSF